MDPSDGNNEAIRQASGNGHLDTVKVLLQDIIVSISALDNAENRDFHRNKPVE